MPPGTRLCLGASNNIVFLDVFDTRHGFLEIPIADGWIESLYWIPNCHVHAYEGEG
jgi:hypothetical protein